MTDSNNKFALQSLVELVEFNKTNCAGYNLTFCLPDDQALQAFLAIAHQNNSQKPKYLLSLVPLTTDRKEIPMEKRQRIENALREKPISKGAATICRDASFWNYLELIDVAAGEGDISEEQSKRYLLRICQIRSIRDLDNDMEAAQRYHVFIENPFLAWLAPADVSVA